MRTIYLDKYRMTYKPRTDIVNKELNTFAKLLTYSVSGYWRKGLLDDKISLLEDSLLRLQKDKEIVIITLAQLGDRDLNPYKIHLQKFKQVLYEWYKATETNPEGILLVFINDDIQVIPDIEAIGDDELTWQVFNTYIPEDYIYRTKKDNLERRRFSREYGVLSTTDWPDELEESEIIQKQSEAIDYINTYNVKGFWDPYTEITTYYGYTKDGLLIQFVCDEEGNPLVNFPIYL